MADDTATKAASTAEEAVPITAPAKEGQTVVHEGASFTTIREGLAHILVPHGIPTVTNPRAKDDEAHQSVFYNPIQQFNRDLSVLAIRAFGEDLVEVRRRRAEQSSKSNKRKDRRKKKGGKDAESGVPTGALRAEEGQLQEQSANEKVRDAGPEAEGTNADANRFKRKRDAEAGVGNSDAAILQPTQHPEASNSQEGHCEKKPKLADPNGDSATGHSTAQGSADSSSTNQGEQVADEDLAALGKSMDGNEAGKTEGPADAEARPAWKPSFRILDALSATGLRALRYAQELPFVTSVTANDMSQKATEAIALNVRHNKLENIIKPNTSNAMAHMYSMISHDGPPGSHAKYDVIDLDPYGTAAIFLDAALQAINDNGLLCVTCTDAGVFNSAGYPEKCYALYGGIPSRGFHGHEVGLRLILHSIATAAARYGIAIEPVLSLSIDYYARVFVRVRKSPADVKFLAGKQMVVYECDQGCGAWQTQYLAKNHTKIAADGKPFYKYSLAQAPTGSPYCEHCGTKTHLVGPMFGGPLHNKTFVRRILSYLPDLDPKVYGTIDRIEGMLETACEETLLGPAEAPAASSEKAKQEQSTNSDALIPRMDPAQVDPHPFYFVPSHLARVLRCQAPSDAAFKGALRHAGFKTTRSHCKPGTIRTDAPWAAIWHIMREWVRQKAPIKESSLSEGTAGFGILKKGKELEELLAKSAETKNGEDSAMNDAAQDKADGVWPKNKPYNFKVVFDEKLGKDKEPKRLVRYQVNPRADWGPMKRAK